MKSSFWRRWCNSFRSARPTGPISRGRPQRLGLEALEDRVTPTLTPQMVLDIGVASSNPSQLVVIGSTTYFTADDGVHGSELWKTDGTTAGTTQVKDISSPGNLTNVNGALFFTGSDPTNGYGLWKSDGTPAGTVPVSSLGDLPGNLTAVNGTLFFSQYDYVNGLELWKSDGTAAGTTLVKDLYPGIYWGYWGQYPNSSNPGNLTNVNGTLFFTAYDGTDTKLWKSDGTEAGTVALPASQPSSLTIVNGTLFFSATDYVNGQELWKSDGTAAGTVLVKDIWSGSGSSYPNGLTNVNGTLFFRANDGSHGGELWKSDGTAAGTVLVKDIRSGSGSSYPGSLTAINGLLFFTANDGTGTKLWQSDGTEAGTVPVANLAASWLTNANGTLFFTANDGTHGQELWMLVDDAAQGTRLNVSGFPGTITAGAAGSFTVTAKNPDGTTNTGYLGAVHFTSTDPQAVLPADYTFTAADNGVHTFSATLKTAGSQSITTRDTVVPGVAGSQGGITVTPAAASRITVGGFPSPVTAGVAGSFTVTALDAYGNRATDYTGTVRFTSSDAQAVLPGNYTFTAADAGVHTFSAVLKTAGYQSLTATDTVNGAFTGAQSVTVNPAAASRLILTAPASVKAGAKFSLTVSVVDAYGNVVTGYRGTLSLSSSTPTTGLPKKYTFTAADAGTHTFTGLTLKKRGKQTITATDTVADPPNSSITGSVSIQVL